MGKSRMTYADFAENDYLFFKAAYDDGLKGSPMAALGQSICECYLKHIISEYAIPTSVTDQSLKAAVLCTHNLRRLTQYIEDEMNIEIPSETESLIERINGFYFTTRYPGDESFIPTERDIDKTYSAVEASRKFVRELCEALEDGDNK